MIGMFVALFLQATSSIPPTDVEITVQGRKLDDAYRACIAGQCSVLRDAQVSIAFAEQQFRNGRYREAKHSMAMAVARNRNKAATDPKPVAALYEAYATVAIQEGDREVYRKAVAGQVRTLNDNLPEGDPARQGAMPALGDMWLKLGNVHQATAAYRRTERQARARGDIRGAGIAQLRQAAIASALRDRTGAQRLLAAAAATGNDPLLQTMMRVTALRIAANNADDGEMDRLIREIGAVTAQPVLVWQPTFPESTAAQIDRQARRFDFVSPVQLRSGDSTSVHWIDVGFWIRPDGRTRDPEVLRGGREQDWARPVLEQIGGRRYTAFANAGGQGVYRIERITNRGTYSMPVGSLIKRRAGPRSIETLDLTGSATMITATR